MGCLAALGGDFIALGATQNHWSDGCVVIRSATPLPPPNALPHLFLQPTFDSCLARTEVTSQNWASMVLNFPIMRRVHSFTRNLNHMEAVEWPTHVPIPQPVKDIIARFYLLVDSNDPQDAQELADEVFTPDGRFVVNKRVLKGPER
jgi:hypothetical protein